MYVSKPPEHIIMCTITANLSPINAKKKEKRKAFSGAGLLMPLLLTVSQFNKGFIRKRIYCQKCTKNREI